MSGFGFSRAGFSRGGLMLLASVCAFTVLAAKKDAPARIERGNLVIEGIAEIPADVAERLNQYQQTRSASFEGWLPQGGMLIGTRFGETVQIHRVDRPGGARHQLTFYPEPVTGATPAPDGDGFLFSKDKGGDEFYQIHGFDFGSGRTHTYTDGKSRNTSPLWSNGGRYFAYSTTRRNGQDTDIHVMSAIGGDSRPVLEDQGTWSVLDWSIDDRELLVGKYISISESELWIVPLGGGERRRFHPAEAPLAMGPALFSRDGKGVYYVSDEGSEFKQLRFENLDGSKPRVLTADTPWDVEDLALSPRGSYLACTVNVDGISQLQVLQLKTVRPLALPKLPLGYIGSLKFDSTGKNLGFVVNGARNASDVYSIELTTRKLSRWTYSETGGLDASAFTEPELIRYTSFDGKSIPAFYYRAAQTGPRPVLIQIHGGPEAQALPVFNPLIEYHLREMGVSVLVPNVRGSDGYGKTYLALDNGRLREDSVKDIGSLLDWIATRPELDGRRVAVAGGSYGGYMSLAAMTHFNDRLRAGIASVGIGNFVTFLTNTQDYRRDLRRVEYGDERDPEMRKFLEAISPTANAHKITKPLFLIQGANDPRVPATEAEAMLKTVRGNGGEVWYLLARDEGHGFRKKINRDYSTSASAVFLQKYLLNSNP